MQQLATADQGPVTSSTQQIIANSNQCDRRSCRAAVTNPATSVNLYEAASESCELGWVPSHPRTEDDLSEGLKNPRFFVGL